METGTFQHTAAQVHGQETAQARAQATAQADTQASAHTIAQTITRDLFARRDATYAAFQSKLMPTVAPALVIGVRMPQVRALAKTLERAGKAGAYMHTLPHTYYEENMLHAVLLSHCTNFAECITLLDEFLPYVDNWAVCDALSPQVFAANTNALMPHIARWLTTNAVYTQRFALKMLMTHYLDEHFCTKYLDIPAHIHTNEYYVAMMIAWFYATALAKQWEDTAAFLRKNTLNDFVHNKTIQKACESRRLSAEQKAYLRTLRR